MALIMVGDDGDTQEALLNTKKKKNKKPPTQQDKFKLPEFDWKYLLAAILLIFIIKYQPQQIKSDQEFGSDITISGKIVSKQINQSGGLKLIIDDQFHNTQNNLIIATDIALDCNLVVGEQISVKAQPLGNQTFTCSDIHKIRHLTQLVNFESLNNVYIHKGVATWQGGHINLNGVPDGQYQSIIISQDDKGQVQVLQVHP